jgi:CxxC motif-containing protein (DUF1111 family)
MVGAGVSTVFASAVPVSTAMVLAFAARDGVRVAQREAMLGLLMVGASTASLLLAADALDIPPDALSAGAMTVADTSSNAYLRSSPLLNQVQLKQVADGRQFFETKWAFYWFEQGLWGRGPTSNAESCATCHVGNGRGKPPAGGSLPCRWCC